MEEGHKNLETKAKRVRGVVRQGSDSEAGGGGERLISHALGLRRDLRKLLTHPFPFFHI